MIFGCSAKSWLKGDHIRHSICSMKENGKLDIEGNRHPLKVMEFRKKMLNNHSKIFIFVVRRFGSL